MLTTRNERAEDALIRQWAEETSDDRTGQWPGVTSLIYCLTKSYYEHTFLPQRPSRELSLIFATGLWLEKVILGPTQNATAGEKDGIYYHTDHMVFDDDGTPTLGEVKTTNYSAKKDFAELNPSWHKQMMSYAYAEGTTKASAIILHKRGDYHNGPFTNPDIRVWDVEFTQQELVDNWAWMLGRKYILDEAIEQHVPPDPFEWRVIDWTGEADINKPVEQQGYECDGCPWLQLCDQRSKGLL